MNQYEREEEQLERDLSAGIISNAEYNKELRAMQQSYREEMRAHVEEAAERAYNDFMGNW